MPFCWTNNVEMYNFMVNTMKDYKQGLLYIISNNKADRNISKL